MAKRQRNSNRHQNWENGRNGKPHDSNHDEGIINPLKGALNFIFNKDGLNLSTLASGMQMRASDLRKARCGRKTLTENQRENVISAASQMGWQAPANDGV